MPDNPQQADRDDNKGDDIVTPYTVEAQSSEGIDYEKLISNNNNYFFLLSLWLLEIVFCFFEFLFSGSFGGFGYFWFNIQRLCIRTLVLLFG